MASEIERQLARLEKAARRVSDAEATAARERDRMYAIVRDAQAAGASLSAMARAMGVSRQAVQKIMLRLDRG